MSDREASLDDGEAFRRVRQRIADRSKKVVQTKEILSKQAVQTKEILSKQAVKIAKQAEEHERFINKVTHLVGVLGFGVFCYLLGARPQDVPYVYCFFYFTFVPARWIYYRYKKWHYYLLSRETKLHAAGWLIFSSTILAAETWTIEAILLLRCSSLMNMLAKLPSKSFK